MLTDFQKKWVAALRSGEYLQGVGVLSRNNAHCCLGVACKVADLPSEEHESVFGGHYITFDNMQVGIEFELYQDMFGIKDALGSFIVNEVASKITGEEVGRTTHLAFLNDRGFTFEQIANIIESEPVWISDKEAVND